MGELAVCLRGVCYSYPSGVVALHDVDLEIEAGESVGIVGPNGAGKTTLFLCLSGILEPNRGQICVGDLNLGEPRQRRQVPGRLGIVFQNSDDQLFHASVRDEVAFGPLNLELPEDEVRNRVAEALKQVGLVGFEERVPFHLSGGEKRRVALAGVLAMRPDILLLDEPSSHLDPRGRRELIHLINNLANTKLIASHDLEFIVATCERAVVLDQGRIVGDGHVRRILGDRDLMENHGLEVPHSLTHPHVHF